MEEYPIIFSAPMVRAILEGKKTQTRRVVRTGKLYGMEKKNPEDICDVSDFSHGAPSFDAPWGFYFDLGDDVKVLRCPYGERGDRLWVRESFLNNALPGYPPVWFYRADGEDKPADRQWKPSILPINVNAEYVLSAISKWQWIDQRFMEIMLIPISLRPKD